MKPSVRRMPVRLFLSVFAGILLSLAWLGFSGLLLFVAFLPLLLLDDFFVTKRQQFTSVSFWGYSFLAFFIWNVLTTWWIVHATVAGAFFAIIANTFLMSLVFWIAHVVRRNTQQTTGYLAFIVFWISFEFAHFHWDIEWPWLTLGNGFADNVRMIQWYEFTGTLGGSLWVFLVNIMIYQLLKKIAERQNLRRLSTTVSLLVILIFLPLAWSFFRYYIWHEIENPRKILIIQPNIDPYSEKFDAGAVNEKLLKFIRLAEKGLAPDIDYIVGPETVFEENWDEDRLSDYPAFRQLQTLLKVGNKTSLIIGASTYRVYGDQSKAPSTARHTKEGAAYDVFNTALFTDPSGNFQSYHKSILVPGVEKMPFRKYLKFLDRLIIQLGGTNGSLGIQKEPTNFAASNGDQIAPAICYESVFGGYIAEFVRKGAGMIFVITNDGWWKNTPGYRQHFSFARLRAVETRRSIVRSANTGISAFINQRGEVIQHSQWWVESALTGKVNVNHQLTFYVKYGDYIARIALLISVFLLMNLIIIKLIRTKKNPHQF